MSHLVRQEIPRKWPIERKGTPYIVRPQFNLSEGMPLLIILREIMGLAKTRREVKNIIHSNHIFLNEKIANDEKNNVLLFDTLKITSLKKAYRLSLTEKGKFCLEEIKETEADKKISKIINKKILKGKKIQLNLSDGRNFLSNVKVNTNDSVLINLKENKVEKVIPLKQNSQVIVFSGKHVGKKGKILEINEERKMAKINSNNEELNILLNQLMVIE
jgi:small subunit ribosomal protein S4e